jgi:hypothetical protein
LFQGFSQHVILVYSFACEIGQYQESGGCA